jgi:5-methylcytosine-specific restriction endonuclease McrA
MVHVDFIYCCIVVTFQAVEFLTVKHWDRTVTKTVPVSLGSLNVWKKFLHNIRLNFDEEIGTGDFRLYSMPIQVINLDERVRIDSGDKLIDFLECCNRKLYVFNCKYENSESPTKLPAEVDKKEAACSQSQSSTGRNSNNAKLSKNRDKYTCLLCGYLSSNETSVEACHIFELRHYKTLSVEEKALKLASFHLDSIESPSNLITLCLKCHKKFDSYDFVFHPVDNRIEMTDKLLKLPQKKQNLTGAGTSFKSLNGKVIAFNGDPNFYPPTELKQYRYEFLGRVEAPKQSKKRKNAG